MLFPLIDWVSFSLIIVYVFRREAWRNSNYQARGDMSIGARLLLRSVFHVHYRSLKWYAPIVQIIYGLL